MTTSASAYRRYNISPKGRARRARYRASFSGRFSRGMEYLNRTERQLAGVVKILAHALGLPSPTAAAQEDQIFETAKKKAAELSLTSSPTRTSAETQYFPLEYGLVTRPFGLFPGGAMLEVPGRHSPGKRRMTPWQQ